MWHHQNCFDEMSRNLLWAPRTWSWIILWLTKIGLLHPLINLFLQQANIQSVHHPDELLLKFLIWLESWGQLRFNKPENIIDEIQIWWASPDRPKSSQNIIRQHFVRTIMIYLWDRDSDIAGQVSENPGWSA